MCPLITIDIEGWAPERVLELLSFVEGQDSPPARIPETIDSLGTSYAEGADEGTGWTAKRVRLLAERLIERHHSEKVDVFNAAIERGGYIARADVYREARYPKDRKLTSFTSPFQEAVRHLVQDHGLAEDAPSPLEAVYESDSDSFRPLSGYQVAPEILALFEDVNDKNSDPYAP